METSSSEQDPTTRFDNIECKDASATQSLHEEVTPLTADSIAISNRIQPDPTNPHHRRHLPQPVPPSQCPLLCVFYAEFDIVIGPRVCYQSPQKFMQLDVDVDVEEIHHALQETFLAVLPKKDEKKGRDEIQMEDTEVGHFSENSNNMENEQPQCNELADSPGNSKQSIQQLHEHDEYWKWSSSIKQPPIIEREVSDASASRSLSSSRQNLPTSASNIITAAATTRTSSSSVPEVDGNTTTRGAGSKSGSNLAENIATPATATKPIYERKQSDSSIAHSRNPSYSSSSKGTSSNINQQLPNEGGGDASTIDTELLQNSIFAATSEYIITGNELANRSITVSTHGMHILSRPNIISDTQRYERNSLLFAVGFVLRRGDTVDPCHFWPVLSKLSSTLYDMEMESEFLSNGRTRSQIQIILEDVLISLNSKQNDCHLLLDNANLMNLQLFHPPPPQTETPPVPDYAVPMLLRPEWQLQMYDWDLTINWIVPHIDGCQCVKQIAASTEVDMEMVRACLRVLRHHGVLTHVDVFRYSNVYEFQGFERLVSGGELVKRMMTEAVRYSAKSKYVTRRQPMPAAPWTSAKMADEFSTFAPRSSPSLTGHFPTRKEHLPDDNNDRSERSRCPDMKEIGLMAKALKQLYCSLSRDKSFAEVLLEKIESMKDPSYADIICDEDNPAHHGDDTLDNKKGIDWNLIFDFFDHRRLVTFGLFQGLIRRVHQYPLAYRIRTDNYESSISGIAREGEDSHCDVKDNITCFHSSAVAEEAASIAAGPTIEERSVATSCSASQSPSTFAPSAYCGRTEMFPNKATKDIYRRSRNLFIEGVARAMNGTRCDDELSCMFDVPVERLIEMLQSTGRWNVISVYSCVE